MYFREILNLQVIPWRFDFFFCKFKNEIVKVKALLYCWCFVLFRITDHSFHSLAYFEGTNLTNFSIRILKKTKKQKQTLSVSFKDESTNTVGYI